MPSPAAPSEDTVLELERFLPYRLSILSEGVSRSIARLYEERFDLTIAEWRVMAVLGRHGSRTATEVGQLTLMDKVRVSRAIARLAAAGRVSRTPQRDDRRRAALTLTEAGLAIYREIAPLALSVEADLLASLTPAERAQLDTALELLGKAFERWRGRR